jgi:hypothetical protein
MLCCCWCCCCCCLLPAALQNILYDLSLAGTRGLASATNDKQDEEQPADAAAVDNAADLV